MGAKTNKVITEELLNQMPDDRGHFGPYGGRFVSETLMPSLLDLEENTYLLKMTLLLGKNLIRIWLTMLVVLHHFILRSA